MAFVAHDILGPHTRLPDAGGDRAPQNQVGAEHSALAHLCARFKEAALPVPPGLVREEGGWGVGDSAVQSELLSVSLGGLADVLEPAGDEQASAERPEPALPPKAPGSEAPPRRSARAKPAALPGTRPRRVAWHNILEACIQMRFFGCSTVRDERRLDTASRHQGR